MINVLSYVGMNMQSEVCLWCILGLVRTIFDATLFKVNANLKQVWQMSMPAELSMPVQRALRTMVSGVMLVQCFTVYVYLAAYIVLLYPVFLEERPTLVLPWLLLAAVRKLLCELTSLALGLGTCLLLGPARPPCIKFVIVKFTAIIPVFYMWMLVFSYYHALKVATAFKTFSAVLPPNDNNYGLELAVRRRRTKSLLGEEQLRKKLVASFYREGTPSTTNETYMRPDLQASSKILQSTDSLNEEGPEADVTKPLTTGWSDIGAYEDWFGSEVMIPRDTDRILEQIVLMLLRVGVYLKKEGKVSFEESQILNSSVPETWQQQNNIDCSAMNGDVTDTPPHIGSSKGNIASYLREYPQIFMKKQGNSLSRTDLTFASLKAVHSLVETNEGTTSNDEEKQNSPSIESYEAIAPSEFKKVPSKRKTSVSNSNTKLDDKIVKLALPSQSQTKRNKIRLKLQKERASERQSEKCGTGIINSVLDNLQQTKISPMDSSDYNDNNKKVTKLTTPTSNVGSSKKSTENAIPQLKENNDQFKFGVNSIARGAISKESSEITILNENTTERSYFSIFTEDNISKVDKSKCVPCAKITKEDSTSTFDGQLFNSNQLNLNKNKDEPTKKSDKKKLPEHEMYKNKELPLRILSSDENIINKSLDENVSCKDLADENTSPEVKDKDDTDDKTLDDVDGTNSAKNRNNLDENRRKRER